MNKKILKNILIVLSFLFLISCNKKNMQEIRMEGIDLYENEKYEEALNKFDEALKLGDGEIGKMQYDLILYKAECEYRLGNYKKARELYEVLLTIDKNNKDYKKMFDASSIYEKISDAKDAINSNDLNKAEVLLNEVRNSGYENDKSYLFNEIILAEKRNLYKDAYALIERYLKSYPNDEEILKELEFVKTRLEPIKEPETVAPKETETDAANKNKNKTTTTKKKKN